MVWVGKSSEESYEYHMTSGATGSGLWSQKSSLPAEHQQHINFDLIVKNVMELNVLAGEGSSEVTKTPEGAKLKVNPPCVAFQDSYFCMSRTAWQPSTAWHFLYNGL